VTVDSTGEFVYVVNFNSNNVSAYTIDASTGALTPVVGSPFAAGQEPSGISTCQGAGQACIPPPL
jgi:6-phosphogluconolactonase (cycloisomerase 2 family)